MPTGKTLSILIMDPPYESPNTATAFRLIQAALHKGHHVNVFAYEGAVSLSMRGQTAPLNPIRGTAVEEAQRRTTKDWIISLFQLADQKGVPLTWTNCGLCVDERRATDWLEGCRSGSPKDFYDMATHSDATLVIPAR